MNGTDFLDLSLAKDCFYERSGNLTIKPFLKDTSLLQVLNVRSAHNSSIHANWMHAYILRLRRHTNSVVWFRTFKSEMLKRLINAGTDHAIVAGLDRSTCFTFPLNLNSSWIPVLDRSIKHKSKCIWISLPYHPIWAGAINSALRCVSEHHELREITRQFIDSDVSEFRAAWRLSMPSLNRVMRRNRTA